MLFMGSSEFPDENEVCKICTPLLPFFCSVSQALRLAVTEKVLCVLTVWFIGSLNSITITCSVWINVLNGV